MHRKTAENITASLLLAILMACSSGTQEKIPAEVSEPVVQTADTVTAATKDQATAQHQEKILIKSGKVRASKYIDLYFNTQGHIGHIAHIHAL